MKPLVDNLGQPYFGSGTQIFKAGKGPAVEEISFD